MMIMLSLQPEVAQLWCWCCRRSEADTEHTAGGITCPTHPGKASGSPGSVSVTLLPSAIRNDCSSDLNQVKYSSRPTCDEVLMLLTVCDSLKAAPAVDIQYELNSVTQCVMQIKSDSVCIMEYIILICT